MATYKATTAEQARQIVERLNARQHKRNTFINITVKEARNGYRVKEG